MTEQVQSIDVETIAPSPFNPRREFNKEALGELADSIRVQGIQVALIVRPAGKGYELIAGERRWRAAKLAGLAEVPAVVRDLDDRTARAVQIVENLQRQDLAPLEEAQGFRDYLDNGGEMKALAAAVGKSPRYIYARMQMLTLAPAARKELAEGAISPGHASELAALPPALQGEVLERVHDAWGSDMSVQELRKHIADHYRLSLDAAPWPKDDPVLNAVKIGKKGPRAGPCSICPKRAGSNLDKFAGLKPNTCTDPECFRAKAAVFVELRREKNRDLLLVAFPDNGASQQDFKALPYSEKELVAPYGYTRNAKCEAAQTALVVASHDATQIGRTIEICRDRKCKTHHPPEYSYKPSKPSKAELRRKTQREADEKVARAAFVQTIEHARKQKALELEDWRLIALESAETLAAEFPGSKQSQLIREAFGNQPKLTAESWVKKQNAHALQVFVLARVLSAAIEYGNSQDSLAAAKRHGVDLAALRKQLAPPAKKAVAPTSAKTKAKAARSARPKGKRR